MDGNSVKTFYSQDHVVEQYADATARVGLWVSEEKIFTQVFKPEQVLLELGCGTARISVGLWELGYRHLMATDFAKGMVKKARNITKVLNYPIHVRQEDATKLSFEDNSFEGIIFGFNGLMQIPFKEKRYTAMQEIYRVLKPGHFLIFTSHDRTLSKHRKFWEKEQKLWRHGKQNPDIHDFGDRYEETDEGKLFIHIPDPKEIRKDLSEIGFRIDIDVLRSKIAVEPPEVREFSDECRFWIVQKPEVQ